jgi:hypothetical protein
MSLAVYMVTAEYWTDMPEAKPRARARVKKNRPGAQVTVADDGTLEYAEDAGIEIDRYEDPKYKEVREEVRHSAPPGLHAPKVRLAPRSATGPASVVVRKDQ